MNNLFGRLQEIHKFNEYPQTLILKKITFYFFVIMIELIKEIKLGHSISKNFFELIDEHEKNLKKYLIISNSRLKFHLEIFIPSWNYFRLSNLW